MLLLSEQLFCLYVKLWEGNGYKCPCFVRNMNRKGQTVGWIIAIVLAVAALLILLAFLNQIDEDYSSDEICRLSVLGRATAAEAIPGTQQNVPLQCTTKKICLTGTSKGSCSQFVGEKNVVNVELPSLKANDLSSVEQQTREIERVMAESMYSCWRTLGEGKLDLFSTTLKEFGFSQSQSTCVICSRVALADDISQTIVSRINVSRYMEKNTVPGSSLTYMQALTDGVTNTYLTFKEGALEKSNIELGGVSTNELAFVFMQVKAEKVSEVLEKQAALVGIAGAGTFIARPSAIAATSRFLFSGQGLIVAGVAAVAVGGTGTYNALRSQDVAVGYCGPFVTKTQSNAKEGCSLLQGLPYSVNDIGKLCRYIEGNV